jgi:DNA polymerase-3 subunit beta
LSLKEFPKNPNLKEGFVVAARALSDVFKLAQGENVGKIDMYFTKEANQIIFSLEGAQVATRLIEGEYPAFTKIIPESTQTQVTFDKTELAQSVKFAAVYAKESANIVKLTVGQDNVVISANTPQVGENRTSITAKVEGEGGEIAFNARFLQDVLNVFPEESVVFEMNGPLAPGVFKPLEDRSYLHIIMPVRVQE